jgi:NAD(P)-dependent dehydrogenase (short-subunit alcohol dehydrogenase family)
MFRPDLLAGKRILVTGGGTGLGRSMARRFAELGASLVLAGRRGDVLEDAARDIADATGAAVETQSLDVRDPEAVEAAMSRIFETGPLDALVNNAAANFIARTETLSHRAADAILNITLHGPLYCTMAAGRRWLAGGAWSREQPMRCVLNILATYAWHGSAYVVPSAMAKAGVHAMMQSLAVEWGPRGVRFAGIAPGPFPTQGAWERLLPKPGMADTYETRGPLKRPGEHSELANLAAYLLADEAAYVNGDCVTIDGGRWLQGAGNFSFLDELSEEDWAGVRAGGRRVSA